MRGIEADAGGVDSFRRRSNTKKATNIFIPVKISNKIFEF
jgi:hypothetical protein